jgi:hypothetical protein
VGRLRAHCGPREYRGLKGFLPIDAKETTPEGLSGAVFRDVFPKDRPDVGNLREILKTGDLIMHVDVGINIARADEVQTFVIPSDVVQKVISEVKGKAEKK